MLVFVSLLASQDEDKLIMIIKKKEGSCFEYRETTWMSLQKVKEHLESLPFVIDLGLLYLRKPYGTFFF